MHLGRGAARSRLGAAVTEGTVRFTLTNVDNARLTGFDYIVFMMHSENGDPNLPDAMALRVGGSAGGPEGLGQMVLEAWDGVAEAKRFSGPMSWVGSQTYTLEIQFGRGRLSLRRNGAVVYDFSAIKGGHPVSMRYRYIRLPMPLIRNHAFDAVAQSIYPMFSISAYAPAVTPDAGTKTDAGVKIDGGTKADGGARADAGEDADDAGWSGPDASEPTAETPEEPWPTEADEASPSPHPQLQDDPLATGGCNSAAPGLPVPLLLVGLLFAGLRARGRHATRTRRPREATQPRPVGHGSRAEFCSLLYRGHTTPGPSGRQPRRSPQLPQSSRHSSRAPGHVSRQSLRRSSQSASAVAPAQPPQNPPVRVAFVLHVAAICSHSLQHFADSGLFGTYMWRLFAETHPEKMAKPKATRKALTSREATNHTWRSQAWPQGSTAVHASGARRPWR